MLHMSFVGSVHGALDWDTDVIITKTRESMLFSVIDAWYVPPEAKPPEPQFWESAPFEDEWVGDHIHRVLHKATFATEYIENEATSLQSYLELTHWKLQLVRSEADLSANSADPIQFSVSCFSSKATFEVLFDTGASHSFTHDLDDFISELRVETMSVGGFLGVDAPVVGSGTVQWNIRVEGGKTQTIITEAYYVPSGQRRLFCPQRHFQEWEKSTQDTSPGSFTVKATTCTYTDNLGWTARWSMLSLPVVQATRCSQCQASPTVLDPANTNLTSPQKELKLWHDRLGHCGFGWVQRLMRGRTVQDEHGNRFIPPCIPTRLEGTRKCQPPLCASCLYGKQQRTSEGTDTVHPIPSQEMALQRGDLQPGDCISMDQYESTVRGRLPHTAGREPWFHRYVGGTLFVDHASGFVKVYHQSSLGAPDTIRSKRKFEQEAGLSNISVKRYHGDNGIFKSAEFKEETTQLGQAISFSGVGAHHQNGKAERAIKTIFFRARSMMLHASMNWPDSTNESLWPFAVEYAVHLWNHSEGIDSGMAPAELFSGTKHNCGLLRHARVWGCPAYVLDPKLQDGKKLPKWTTRSRRGQFLGISNNHSRHIGTIRNLGTGYVTPQFHVIYDELFGTVTARDGPFDPAVWNDLFLHHRDYVPDEDDVPPELADEWLTQDEVRRRHRTPVPAIPAIQRPVAPDPLDDIPDLQQQGIPHQVPALNGLIPPDAGTSPANAPPAPTVVNPEPEHEIVFDNMTPEDEANAENENETWAVDNAGEPNPSSDDETTSSVDENDGTHPAPHEEPARRSRRANRGVNRRYADFFALSTILASTTVHPTLARGDGFLRTLDWDAPPKNSTAKALLFLAEITHDDDIGHDTIMAYPTILAVKANDADLPTFAEAMASEDAEGFCKAMDQEIQELVKKFAWDLVPASEPEALKKKVFGTLWAFRRKRYPDGSLRKLKARICCRGDQQVLGVDVFETYAPVISWAVVRLALTTSVAMNWATAQVDYANAFVQAKLDEPVYITCPRRYEVPGHVLRLKRSLYGLRESPLNWFSALSTGLQNQGFKQCRQISEPCLFLKKDVMIVVYVDDCIFIGTSLQVIDRELDILKKTFDLEKEEDMAGFLGVAITTDKFGAKTLAQVGLIDRILRMTDMLHSTGKATPAAYGALGKDLNGKPRLESWNYRAVIGMMLYLSSNSRPDIAFAVNQCARYCSNPTLTHEIAVKRIVRYLKQTRDRGMIISPKPNLTLDLYVDADFAGLWNLSDTDDPSVVRSRTGYVITLGAVPVVWKSKLQTEIALSTCEAEYIAASQAMRELLPLLATLNTITTTMGIPRDPLTTISSLWEDNEAALTIMTNHVNGLPKLSPRTRHISCKYHWFLSKLGTNILAKKIHTKQQKADIFTKGMRTEDFEHIRFLLLGW